MNMDSYVNSPTNQAVCALADALVTKDRRPDGSYLCSKCGGRIGKFEVQWSIDMTAEKISGPLCGACMPKDPPAARPDRIPIPERLAKVMNLLGIEA